MDLDSVCLLFGWRSAGRLHCVMECRVSTYSALVGHLGGLCLYENMSEVQYGTKELICLIGFQRPALESPPRW
jgi:hypothetical protein